MSKGSYLGEFEQIVLLALARLEEGAYGMAIMEEIEARTGREVAIGSVYSALDRMERKGYLSSRLGEPTRSRGGRAKKYFQVEATGLEALNRSREMVAQLLDGLDLERLA